MAFPAATAAEARPCADESVDSGRWFGHRRFEYRMLESEFEPRPVRLWREPPRDRAGTAVPRGREWCVRITVPPLSRRIIRSSGVAAKLAALSRPIPRFESGLEHPDRLRTQIGGSRVHTDAGTAPRWQSGRTRLPAEQPVVGSNPTRGLRSRTSPLTSCRPKRGRARTSSEASLRRGMLPVHGSCRGVRSPLGSIVER